MKNEQINVEDVRRAILQSAEDAIVYVGADSKCFKPKTQKGNWCVYVTCVIVHEPGRCGVEVFRGTIFERDYGQLRVRLLREAELSLNIATEVLDVIGNRNLQIHLDVNPKPNYASNSCLKEMAGYVFGVLGIEPVVKPDAFAASTVSDRYAVKEAKKHKRKRA